MKRRNFLGTAAGGGLALGTGLVPALINLHAFGQEANLSHIEARYYKKLPDREIECGLCPRKCRLGDKERGYCGVRENDGGTYYTLVYGKVCALNVDPIEKKPFFHVLPKTNALSLAAAGCNVNPAVATSPTDKPALLLFHHQLIGQHTARHGESARSPCRHLGNQPHGLTAGLCGADHCKAW